MSRFVALVNFLPKQVHCMEMLQCIEHHKQHHGHTERHSSHGQQQSLPSSLLENRMKRGLCETFQCFLFFFVAEWTPVFLSFYPFHGFIANSLILFKTHQTNNWSIHWNGNSTWFIISYSYSILFILLYCEKNLKEIFFMKKWIHWKQKKCFHSKHQYYQYLLFY